MFHPNCTVLLYRRLNSADGNAVFEFPETMPGCLIVQQQSSAAAGVPVQEQSLLYLQCAAIPAPGDEAVIDSHRYTIESVRVCRDLQGHIRGFRCSFSCN